MKLSRKSINLLSISFIFIALLGLANGQSATLSKVPSGSKIYVTEMKGELHSFLTAEIIKAKLPVTVVTDDKDADFVIVGASLKADDKWYHTVFGGKDKNEGSAQLIKVKDKSIVWAGEAGDRSLWAGGWKRGGQRKVAERLVKQMKKDLFKD